MNVILVVALGVVLAIGIVYLAGQARYETMNEQFEYWRNFHR